MLYGFIESKWDLVQTYRIPEGCIVPTRRSIEASIAKKIQQL